MEKKVTLTQDICKLNSSSLKTINLRNIRRFFYAVLRNLGVIGVLGGNSTPHHLFLLAFMKKEKQVFKKR